MNARVAGSADKQFPFLDGCLFCIGDHLCSDHTLRDVREFGFGGIEEKLAALLSVNFAERVFEKRVIVEFFGGLFKPGRYFDVEVSKKLATGDGQEGNFISDAVISAVEDDFIAPPIKLLSQRW